MYQRAAKNHINARQASELPCITSVVAQTGWCGENCFLGFPGGFPQFRVISIAFQKLPPVMKTRIVEFAISRKLELPVRYSDARSDRFFFFFPSLHGSHREFMAPPKSLCNPQIRLNKKIL